MSTTAYDVDEFVETFIEEVVEILTDFHNMVHAGPFRFCREAPCDPFRRKVSGPGGDIT